MHTKVTQSSSLTFQPQVPWTGWEKSLRRVVVTFLYLSFAALISSCRNWASIWRCRLRSKASSASCNEKGSHIQLCGAQRWVWNWPGASTHRPLGVLLQRRLLAHRSGRSLRFCISSKALGYPMDLVQNNSSQWEWFLPPREHVAMSEDILLSPLGWWGVTTGI